MRPFFASSRPEPPSPASLEARYRRHAGFHVLRLSGTDYEMGYQHGWLLRESIPRGPLPAFSRYVARVLEQGGLGGLSKPLGAALGGTVGRALTARIPSFARQALDGLADGAGLDRAELLRAVTMPDTYLWVLSRYKKLRGFPPAPRFQVPTLGCTSALAWGEATTNGELLHGRNLDYQGVGSWDREPVVAFHEPAGGQRYVSVSAAGVVLGGVTAMNVAGLTLAVHQHLASIDFDLNGVPVGVVGDRIMRHARSLDDARRILDEHRPSAAWTYVIGSAREKAALCYEVTSRRRASFLAPGDTFAYANIFLAGLLDGTELFAYPSQWRQNTGRYHRASAALRQHRGRVDPEVIASILGDPGGAGCRLRDSISTLQTVTSVVFAPERGLVYVGTGRAPTCNNPFVAFDLNAGCPRPDLPPLAGASLDPPARRAFEAYREAFERHSGEGDAAAARELLDRARAEQPRQPCYHFAAGLLAIERRSFADAEALIGQAIALGHPDPERLAGFHLWRGRARDAVGRRAEALFDYRQAILGDPDTREAARRDTRRPWRPRAPLIEWNFADTISP